MDFQKSKQKIGKKEKKPPKLNKIFKNFIFAQQAYYQLLAQSDLQKFNKYYFESFEDPCK